MMVGFPGPHSPYDPTPEYAARYALGDMPEPIPVVEENARLMGSRGERPARRLWYAYDHDRRPTHDDKRVYTHTLSGSREFGHPGWPRGYPRDIRELF